jgi:hypothetical protein
VLAGLDEMVGQLLDRNRPAPVMALQPLGGPAVETAAADRVQLS